MASCLKNRSLSESESSRTKFVPKGRTVISQPIRFRLEDGSSACACFAYYVEFHHATINEDQADSSRSP